jgi:Ca-activated chloride channel family protein
MNIHSAPGTFEIAVLILFLVGYLLYIIRVVRVSKILGSSPSKVLMKLVFRSLFFALCLIALLGPTFGESKQQIEAKGKDMYIAIDLSESMNAFDIAPTRLEKLKFHLKTIVEAFNADRIGLIIFSSEAFIQCPLTYDQSALNLFIDGMHTGLVPRAGTDFGPALDMALSKIESDETNVSQNNAKIIILISDGEDFGEQSDNMVKKIEDAGIKLFTLGIGTTEGSKILTRNGFKTDREGNEVVTRLDSRSLRKLAAQTGGKYFEVSEERNDVERLINTIRNIEGEIQDTRELNVAENKYFYFLAIAGIILVLDLLFSVRVIKV